MALVLLLFGPVGLLIFLATKKHSVESIMSRWARSGVIAFGLIGAVAGLALGLAANPATAWFRGLRTWDSVRTSGRTSGACKRRARQRRGATRCLIRA